MGTDEHGRDLLSRIIWGGRVTLVLAIIALSLGGGFGILWGLLSAYLTGILGNFLNRLIDLFMSFPSIMTALFVLATFKSGGKAPLVIAISITLTPRFARVIRGSTLPILEEEFILAEQSLGASHLRILMAHVLPNLIAPITVLLSIYLPYVIILEAGLSFLGLGAPPDVPTWGRIIAEGKAFMQVAPWLTTFPGIAIVFTSVGFNILGDGLRDIFDPKYTRRMGTE
ncbi:MAG: ABC transporter permease [Deltaproteobacteria bacterium]|nr:ABC transporter permease [Deltaproteobacteria bacterium]